MTTMTPERFAAEMQAERFDAPVPVTREPGYALEDHSHPFHARALILSGAITLVVGGAARTYGPGEIFDLPPGTPHEESATAGVSYLSARRQVPA